MTCHDSVPLLLRYKTLRPNGACVALNQPEMAHAGPFQVGQRCRSGNRVGCFQGGAFRVLSRSGQAARVLRSINLKWLIRDRFKWDNAVGLKNGLGAFRGCFQGVLSGGAFRVAPISYLSKRLQKQLYFFNVRCAEKGSRRF